MTGFGEAWDCAQLLSWESDFVTGAKCLAGLPQQPFQRANSVEGRRFAPRCRVPENVDHLVIFQQSLRQKRSIDSESGIMIGVDALDSVALPGSK